LVHKSIKTALLRTIFPPAPSEYRLPVRQSARKPAVQGHNEMDTCISTFCKTFKWKEHKSSAATERSFSRHVFSL